MPVTANVGWHGETPMKPDTCTNASARKVCPDLWAPESTISPLVSFTLASFLEDHFFENIFQGFSKSPSQSLGLNGSRNLDGGTIMTAWTKWIVRR